MRVFLVFVAIFFVSFFAAFKVNANDLQSSYENAATAFAENKMNDAFIFVKQALQENPEHLPSKLLMSRLYFDAGNLPAVEEELYEALELGADINLVLPVLGSSLIIQKKSHELLELAKYQIKFNRQSQFEWALLMGQVELLNDNKYQAQAEFEKALKLSPADPRSLNSLALLYMGFGWQQKANDLIEQSLNIAPNNEKTLVLKGELLLAENNSDQALALFEQAFVIDPQDPKILRSLAFLNLRLKNHQEVKKYTELILAQSPLDPAATLISAWRMMLNDDEDLAKQSLAELSSALSLLDEQNLSKDKLTSFIQGASEYLQGNNERARVFLLGHLNTFPGDKSALRMLLEINNDDDMTRQLITLLEKSKKSIVGDLHLGTKLVQLYLSEHKILRADTLLSQVAENFPQHAFVIYLRANIERQRKKPVQALALLTNVKFVEQPPLYFLLLKGELQLQLNDFESVKETANLVLADKSGNIDGYNFVSAIYIKSNQLVKAITLIDTVLSQEPENIMARFNMALVLRAKNDISTFKALIDKILLDNPEHTPSLLLLARHELSLGNTEQVINHTNTVLLYDVKNQSAVELQFAAHTQDNNNSAALAVVKELLKIDRLNPIYLVANIQLLTELDQYQDAERSMNILYGLWSDDGNKLLTLSDLQTKAKFFQAAIKTLARAKELTPNLLSIELALANNYLQLKKDEKVTDIFTDIERQFGKSAELYLLKGDMAVSQNNNSEAFQYYQQSIELKSANPNAIVKLYQLSKQGIESKSFTEIVERLLLDESTPDWVRKMLADSYLIQNKLAKAQHHYELLLTRDNLAGEPSILNNLANIYAHDDLDKALLTAKNGLELGSKNPSLLDTIGWLLTKQMQYNEALSFLRQAFTMNASSPAIRYHLGFTLNELGRSKEAIKELEAALTNGDNFSEYEAAKLLLKLLKA